MLRAAVLAACVLAAPSAFADAMYKWVDEKGVTHFSSDPPPDGKAQKIDVKPAPPSSSAPPKPLTLEEVRKRALDLHDERLAKEKRDEDAKAAAEKQKARCLQARDNLEGLERARRIYSLNERGERVYVDDNERAAALARAQKAVETSCGG
jgi:hypothetical protein